jgi:predicted RNA polymerase sigma factor
VKCPKGMFKRFLIEHGAAMREMNIEAPVGATRVEATKIDALLRDPEKTAARGQVRELLERAIDNLPAPFRVVFVMRMVEQLSTKDTASALGIPEETVKSRLHRAKKLMREQLQTELGSALTDTFPFQDPRCAEFTDALLARHTEGGGPGAYSHERSCSKD